MAPPQDPAGACRRRRVVLLRRLLVQRPGATMEDAADIQTEDRRTVTRLEVAVARVDRDQVVGEGRTVALTLDRDERSVVMVI